MVICMRIQLSRCVAAASDVSPPVHTRSTGRVRACVPVEHHVTTRVQADTHGRTPPGGRSLPAMLLTPRQVRPVQRQGHGAGGPAGAFDARPAAALLRGRARGRVHNGTRLLTGAPDTPTLPHSHPRLGRKVCTRTLPYTRSGDAPRAHQLGRWHKPGGRERSHACKACVWSLWPRTRRNERAGW